MTIDELIAEATDLNQRAMRLNKELAHWPRDGRFGSPMQAAFDLSGTRVFERIAFYLMQARKEA